MRFMPTMRRRWRIFKKKKPDQKTRIQNGPFPGYMRYLTWKRCGHKHLIKLSNGETKRLRIAAALLKNPKLLLLDNPLAGLDVDKRTKFENIFTGIGASGITIIYVNQPL